MYNMKNTALNRTKLYNGNREAHMFNNIFKNKLRYEYNNVKI